MAEIDRSNPVGPTWPQRPLRPIDDKDKSEQQQRQLPKKKSPDAERGGRDDKQTGIDEHA